MFRMEPKSVYIHSELMTICMDTWTKKRDLYECFRLVPMQKIRKLIQLGEVEIVHLNRSNFLFEMKFCFLK
jgi:hypothetical protein